VGLGRTGDEEKNEDEAIPRLLLVTVGFGELGFVMSRPQKNANGAAGAPVHIASSVPLTVTGTVAAQQSGNWNVGITGTPSVNVANTSAIPISGNVGICGQVPLVNPLDRAGNPIPLINRDVDNPARQPFTSTWPAETRYQRGGRGILQYRNHGPRGKTLGNRIRGELFHLFFR